MTDQTCQLSLYEVFPTLAGILLNTSLAGFSQLIVDTNSWLGCSFLKPFRPADVSLKSKESVNESIHSTSGPKRNDKFGFPKCRCF